MGGMPELPDADKLKFNMARMGASDLEMSMFSSGWKLTPEQARALLRARNREEADQIIAASISSRLESMKVDRVGLGDMT